MAAPHNPYRLTLRGTYILPTGSGLLQALGWTLLLAASLNFGLGVMLLFSLLLASLGLVCMVETVRNLAGLEVSLTAPPPGPVDSTLEFELLLRPLDGRPRPALQVALVAGEDGAGWRARLGLRALRAARRVDVAGGGSRLTLPLQAHRRGALQPERVVVASTWPFGLFRAWRGWTPPVQAWVHPAALNAPLHAGTPDGTARDAMIPPAAPPAGAEGDAHGDFHGHRRRQPGDPYRRIDWRASLRSGQLLVAQREVSATAPPTWLRWNDHAPASGEDRLARLATQVLTLARQGRSFGLELPGEVLPPGRGAGQRDLALARLAAHPDVASGRPGSPLAQGSTPAPAEASGGLPQPLLMRWTGNVLLAALPLAFQLPANAWLPWLLLMALRLVLLRSARPAPGTLWLSLGALAGAAWIYAHYHTLFGRESGMALLLIMAGLKLLEVRRARDLHMLTVLSLFLLLSAHFQNQSAWIAAWDLGCGMLLLDGLLAAEQGAGGPARTATLLRMAALALPLGILLFLLLPRPERAFWGLGSSDEGLSGSLSDRMSPGSISRLRLSDQVAFRVRFDGAWPLPSRMYWRGPVLDRFDGQTWSAQPSLAQRAVSAHHGSTPLDYQYEAEAGDGEWVFALDLPEVADEALREDGEAVVRTARHALPGHAWHLRAWPDARIDVERDVGPRDPDLALPEGNFRTRALAAPWQALAPALRVQAAERAFLEAHLQYSLEVPAPGADPVDDLLFGSRIGYCEHFASAFAFMLRAAGVPARIVTGYQGGERNPLGDYLIVRQADAHAWVEAWLPDEGWRRIDPTALTVPALLTGGSQAAAPLPAPRWLPGFLRAGLPVWHRLQLLRDLAAMHWQRDVAQLDARRQRALLASLGLADLPKAQLAAACAVSISAALGVQLLLARRRPARPDGSAGAPAPGSPAGRKSGRDAGSEDALRARQRRQWQRLWQWGERLLGLAGLPRAADEPPLAYCERLTRARPASAPALRAWASACLAGIYGPAGTALPAATWGPGLRLLGRLFWALCRSPFRERAGNAAPT